MSLAKFLTLSVLVVALGLVALFAIQSDDSSSIYESRIDQIAKNDSELQQPDNVPIEPAVITEQAIECIPLASIGQSPDAYLVDNWYATWGAPPSFNQEFSSRPYAHYPRVDLVGLSQNGDAEALHELGRDLVWRALRGGERMPDYQTLWEIGGRDFPYDSRIDTEGLDEGREHLYRAAVKGRIYALIEISLSYAHQAAAEKKNGELDEERGLQMQIEAFAYGEAVEKLIDGFPENFFQASVPEAQSDRASKMLSELVERFTRDRWAAGLDASTLPTVRAEVLDGLNLCIK